MGMIEWAALAEIVGVMGVLVSLVYLNIQFRRSKKSDEREAAFELIRSFQTIEFTTMLRSSFDIPVGLSRSEFEEKLGEDFTNLYAYFAVWESLGIMVYRGQISLDLVCDFFSHPLTHAWKISEHYLQELRLELGRDTPW